MKKWEKGTGLRRSSQSGNEQKPPGGRGSADARAVGVLAAVQIGYASGEAYNEAVKQRARSAGERQGSGCIESSCEGALIGQGLEEFELFGWRLAETVAKDAIAEICKLKANLCKGKCKYSFETCRPFAEYTSMEIITANKVYVYYNCVCKCEPPYGVDIGELIRKEEKQKGK